MSTKPTTAAQQSKRLLSKTTPIDDNQHTPNSSALSSKLMIAVVATILTTFCNGLSYYGISGSLNLFLLNELNQSKATASINTSLFTGTRFFITIVGAVVADACLGRYKTIIIALCIYVCGAVGVAIVSIELSSNPMTDVSPKEQILFWCAVYLLAFGSGCLGPNNGSLGAEQFEYYLNNHHTKARQISTEYQTMDHTQVANHDGDIKQKLSKYKESYFQWRYFSNNCATLLSYSVIAYLCQDVSFGIGYTIPAVSIFCGFCIFTFPSKLYYKFKPKGSALIKFIKILYHVLLKQPRRLMSYNQHEIRDVKNVLSIFPFWICYIIYWSVWAQLSTLIYAQGCQLNYRIEALDWNFPIAALSLFSIIPILILIPLFDKCLFPLLRNKYNLKITMLQKMGTGFIFAALSMVAVGVVEIFRRDHSSILSQYPSICDEDSVYISEMSIFWQVPAFVLEGVSEVLTSITGYEFFFNEAPQSMKSVMSALYTMSIGLGSWITGMYIVFANMDKENPWITDDLNDGHLDWYFFCIALLMVCGWIVFLCYARKYEYNDYSNDDEQDECMRSKSELSTLSIESEYSYGNLLNNSCSADHTASYAQ